MSVMTNRRTALFAAGAALLVRAGVAAQATPTTVCARVTAFLVPAGDAPHDAVPSADGQTAWYTAQAHGALGILSVADGKVETVPLGDGSAPHGVIVGPDGAPWITDGGRDEIIRVDPTSHELTRFPTGLTSTSLNTAAFAGDGALWFTDQNGFVGRLDPRSAQVVTAQSPRGRGPYGICATPSGEIWFASLAGSYLGHATFANGAIAIAIFDPPTANAGTRRVWSDSGGRLWTSEWNAGQIAMYDPSAKAWREWRLPGASPKTYAVYVDEQDRVWASDFGSNSLVWFDPANETFATVKLPHTPANVRQLGGRPGEIWGAESAADQIIRVTTACE